MVKGDIFIDFFLLFYSTPDIQQGLNDLGIIKAAYIQQISLPLVFQDQSIVFSHAPIGSGKTTAILMAMAETVDRNLQKTQVLFFGATVEAVVQSQQVFDSIVKYTTITSSVIYYQQPFRRNIPCQVVFGTPLELAKEIAREHISLSDVSLLCFDDADLTINFENIQRIITQNPHAKLMASGSTFVTIPNALEFHVPRHEILNECIEHVCFQAEDFEEKIKCIAELTKIDGQILIFCSVKESFNFKNFAQDKSFLIYI